MAEEHHQYELRQLLACILGPKFDNNTATIIAAFTGRRLSRCILCDERPGVITKVGAIWEWRCITCALELLPDDTWEHRSIHIQPGSSQASCLSTGSAGLRVDLTLRNALRDPSVPIVSSSSDSLSDCSSTSSAPETLMSFPISDTAVPAASTTLAWLDGSAGLANPYLDVLAAPSTADPTEPSLSAASQAAAPTTPLRLWRFCDCVVCFDRLSNNDTVDLPAIIEDAVTEASQYAIQARTHSEMTQACWIMIRERIFNGQFSAHTPAHLPEHGDVYRLFFEILLATLPLDTVEWVEDRNGVRGPPKNMQAEVFHRRYWNCFQKELGAHPSLYNLHHFTIDWLKKKCPEGMLNDLKWHGFTITPLHIEVCVTCAIYAYGIARLSVRADGRRAL